MDFENFLDYDVMKKMGIKSRSEFNKIPKQDIIKSLWYDWVSIGKWNERIFVKY